MIVTKEQGMYGVGNVYILKSLEDFDEYEKLLKEMNPNFLKINRNFYLFKEDFKKYFGKTYKENPTSPRYKIIALEDNEAMADWYWVCQNVDDERDITYVNGLYDIKSFIED